MSLRVQCVTVDCHDARRVGEFWSAMLDLPLQAGDDPTFVEYWLEPGGDSPDIRFLETPDPRVTKNRLHFDLRPDDQDAEVARALELGATHADIGQGDDTHWVVMADVEGNEFCILRPRPKAAAGQQA